MNANLIGRFLGHAARIAADTTVSVSKSVAANTKELAVGVAAGYKGEPEQPVDQAAKPKRARSARSAA